MSDLSFLFNDPVHCADGFNVSIQASERHYCTPRKSCADYTAVELGFPSVADELLTPYAEDSSKPTDTVYGWVPVDVVAQLIIKHGGLVSGELPRSTALETALDSTALSKEESIYCDVCGYNMGVGYINCGMSEDGVCPECFHDNDNCSHPDCGCKDHSKVTEIRSKLDPIIGDAPAEIRSKLDPIIGHYLSD